MPFYYTSRRPRYFARPQTFLTILLACLACWITGYVFSIGCPVRAEMSDTPLWHLICNRLRGETVAYLAGVVLTAGCAFLLNKINYEMAVIPDSGRLPLLFYLLFASTDPDFLPLRPDAAGTLCLIVAMYRLLTSYHTPESRENAYSAGLLIGIGSLFRVQLIWFMPLFWIGMWHFRSLTLRSLGASLIGVVTVYWFMAGWCLWQHDFTPFVRQMAPLAGIGLSVPDGLTWQSAGFLIVILLTFAASLQFLLGDESYSTRSRQMITFFTWMFFWSVVLCILYDKISMSFMSVACVPASLLVSHLFCVSHGKPMFYLFIAVNVSLALLFYLRIWNFL